ncbi:SDR family NAD(P)-dependent oxidoreductase [Rhodoferax sp.]|uniref:SDR family NAD(P)-dependent oxidoreductase n=1 Tax=Rhodoferax sp. TaxID=50421 RepID=UPI002627A58F|nr:SDR family NAD(P)-dependent oxidoreductase [Rhodoferax sp.]MDD3937257.1 SDR family NAD(P)-dependent oxidoreductase [Rhodoferax sp.]
MITPSQALRFAGKSVLVTGSSSGIGAAVAQSFGAAGARVAVHYAQNREAAESVANVIRQAGGQAITLAGDMLERSVPEQLVTQTVQAFGGLDILINNAGDMFGRRTLEQASDADFDRVVGLNIHSAFAICRAATPVMRQAGHGNIINTTSIAARNGGGEGVGLYGSAKAFVSTMTRALAREMAPHGVRVNGVAPGVILTDFHERNSTPEQLEGARRGIPMGRLGTSDECVGAYLFLADDLLSGYITGQIIEVNGGQLMP